MNTEVGYPWDFCHSIHGGQISEISPKDFHKLVGFPSEPPTPPHMVIGMGMVQDGQISEGWLYRDSPNLKRSNLIPGNAPGMLVGEVEGRAFSPKIARSSGKRRPGGQCHGVLVYVFFCWGRF